MCVFIKDICVFLNSVCKKLIALNFIMSVLALHQISFRIFFMVRILAKANASIAS